MQADLARPLFFKTRESRLNLDQLLKFDQDVPLMLREKARHPRITE